MDQIVDAQTIMKHAHVKIDGVSASEYLWPGFSRLCLCSSWTSYSINSATERLAIDVMSWTHQ